MPSSRSSGSSLASGSRVTEYSFAARRPGVNGVARRIVAGPASDRPMLADLAPATSLTRAPTVSSMGVFGSTRVLVVQVDVVGAEPLQGALDRGAECSPGCCRGARPPPECEMMPNFVANTTWLRRLDGPTKPVPR